MSKHEDYYHELLSLGRAYVNIFQGEQRGTLHWWLFFDWLFNRGFPLGSYGDCRDDCTSHMIDGKWACDQCFAAEMDAENESWDEDFAVDQEMYY